MKRSQGDQWYQNWEQQVKGKDGTGNRPRIMFPKKKAAKDKEGEVEKEKTAQEHPKEQKTVSEKVDEQQLSKPMPKLKFKTSRAKVVKDEDEKNE